MKNLILIAVTVLALSACGPASYSDYSDQYSNLPPELKDCKPYRLVSNNGSDMQILHCPNKASDSINYVDGKYHKNATVVTDNPASSSTVVTPSFTATLINKDFTHEDIKCQNMNGLMVCFKKDKS